MGRHPRLIVICLTAASAVAGAFAHAFADALFLISSIPRAVDDFLANVPAPRLFIDDANLSIALDHAYRHSLAEPREPNLIARAVAFVKRALNHQRFSSGGFALDEQLHPA